MELENSNVNSRGRQQKTVEIFISLALVSLHKNLIFLHTIAAFNSACSGKKYVGVVNNHHKINKVACFFTGWHKAALFNGF